MTEEFGKCFTDQVINITGIIFIFFKEKGRYILVVGLFAKNTQSTRFDPQHHTGVCSSGILVILAVPGYIVIVSSRPTRDKKGRGEWRTMKEEGGEGRRRDGEGEEEALRTQ